MLGFGKAYIQAYDFSSINLASPAVRDENASYRAGMDGRGSVVYHVSEVGRARDGQQSYSTSPSVSFSLQMSLCLWSLMQLLKLHNICQAEGDEISRPDYI